MFIIDRNIFRLLNRIRLAFMANHKRSIPKLGKNQSTKVQNPTARRCLDQGATEGLADLLDYFELARITRKSVVTLRRYNMLGIGPSFLRIGRHVRFRREDVLAWLDSCAQRVAQKSD